MASEKSIAVAYAQFIGLMDQECQSAKEEEAVLKGENFRNIVGRVDKDQEGFNTIRNIATFQQVSDQVKILFQASEVDKAILTDGFLKLGKYSTKVGFLN